MATPSIGPVSKERRSYLQKLWVPTVLLIGLVIGELISYATTIQPHGFAIGVGPNGMIFYFHQFPPDPAFGPHVVLTTIEVALLVSLVVIYAKMFIETRANFALGLVVVLVALLLQALLSYPILDDLFYTPRIEPGISSPVSDVIAVCAYTVFLYLSLE
jgi:hypothetical protein